MGSLTVTATTAFACLALTLPTPAAAGFETDSALLFARAQQDGVDQAANPDYQRRVAPELAASAAGQPNRLGIDPFRHDWAPARGSQQVHTMTNRYGARLRLHLLAPPGNGAHPAVLFLTGGLGPVDGYLGLLQSIAEAGYVVLGVEAQGDGGSDVVPPDPAFCRPGPWQLPQEGGLRERGRCAGEPAFPESSDPVEAATGFPARTFVQHFTRTLDLAELDAAYQFTRARKAFAALDAATWLRSSANPLRARVAAGPLGAVGHSLGAHGALVAAAADPQRRFGAVVSLDGYGRLADQPARVPTLFVHADTQDQGPHRTPPDPLSRPGFQDALHRFAAVRVDTAVVTLGGSTHQEWNYIPYQAHNPFCPPVLCSSSRLGERVSLWYATAWLDRYLRGDRKALDRLAARTYGDRVDASSIGQGDYDPVARRNRPPVIAGHTAVDALSPFYRSAVWTRGLRCPELRDRC